MPHASLPENEAVRLATLRRYAIMDTLPEEPFDRLTTLTASCFDVPVAYISFMDHNRQWFKSRVGLPFHEIPRQLAYCRHLLSSPKPITVTDPSRDPAYTRIVFPIGDAPARFYAAVPLRTQDGFTIGSLCILDSRARRFSSAQRHCLNDLASLVMIELERRLELTHLKSALHQSEERFHLFVERAQDYAIVMLDPVGRVISWNEGAERISGYRSDDILGHHISMLYLQEDRAAGVPAQRLECAEQHGYTEDEDWCLRYDGTRFRARNTLTALRDSNGSLRGFCKITRDMTQHCKAEEQIAFLAHYDPLTGLPNRHLFRERIMQGIAQAQRSQRKAGILLFDLDRFKNINDSLGHKQGDTLLKLVAERLHGSLRDGDTVARLGGDEFTMLMTDIGGHEDLNRIAGRLLNVMQEPFALDDQQVFVTPSIGASVYPDDGSDYETLLKHADIAMYRAKTQGRNGYQVFVPNMNPHTRERFSLETDLHKALANQELMLYYQPQIEITTGRIIGTEALIRWRHPEKGMVLPNDFIPIAEETGLIVPIGEWVTRTACHQGKLWAEQGYPELRVAVNLSLRQFQQRDLIPSISDILDDTGMDPTLLELEITESMAMEDSDSKIETLTKLKELGVQLALDDFGTGYSSLNYLKQLPIDTVKIDRSFIRMIMSDPRDAAITKGIIGIAHSLNISVIAEGVDDVRQMEFLRQHNCDALQGYLISRPIPVEEFTHMLTKENAKTLRKAA